MRLLQPIASPPGDLLGDQMVSPGTPLRWMRYVVRQPVREGTLLYNILTRAVVLLSPEEAHFPPGEIPELVAQWFAVPQDHDDLRLAREIRAVAKMLQDPVEAITSYTILTTTDCNARCFYCYEKGRSRIPMSDETAREVAAYIVRHAGGKPVRLHWFGGEPLYNKPVISLICNLLREAGVPLRSNMTSNGLLFDDETVSDAVSLWNLRKVQITLDGTEAVYNRTKAYVGAGGSPYRTVLGNIRRLLDAGVRVSVRLNVGLYNAADLLDLAEELGARFHGAEGFRVYSHALFAFGGATPPEAQRKEVHAARVRLNARLQELGFQDPGKLEKKIKPNRCMADNDADVTILPDGHLGKCEHYTDSDWLGHIGSDAVDGDVRAAFKELYDELPECGECPLYPDCIRLRKCEEAAFCYPEDREEQLDGVRRRLLAFYEKEVSR